MDFAAFYEASGASACNLGFFIHVETSSPPCRDVVFARISRLPVDNKSFSQNGKAFHGARQRFPHPPGGADEHASEDLRRFMASDGLFRARSIRAVMAAQARFVA